MPNEYLRWQIVFKTGWTLKEVDALTMKDLHEYVQVVDGMSKSG